MALRRSCLPIAIKTSKSHGKFQFLWHKRHDRFCDEHYSDERRRSGDLGYQCRDCENCRRNCKGISRSRPGSGGSISGSSRNKCHG